MLQARCGNKLKSELSRRATRNLPAPSYAHRREPDELNVEPFQYNGLGIEIDTQAILEILGDLKQST